MKAAVSGELQGLGLWSFSKGYFILILTIPPQYLRDMVRVGTQQRPCEDGTLLPRR
jgi:hypothetical protein